MRPHLRCSERSPSQNFLRTCRIPFQKETHDVTREPRVEKGCYTTIEMASGCHLLYLGEHEEVPTIGDLERRIGNQASHDCSIDRRDNRVVISSQDQGGLT
jgi:hypothetical protein